jgi:hypothetical protein
MAIKSSDLFLGGPKNVPSSDTIVRFAKTTKQFTPKHKMVELSYEDICLQGIDWDQTLPAMEFKLHWGRIKEGWDGEARLRKAFSRKLIQSYWSLMKKNKALPKDAIYLKSGRFIRVRDIMKYPPTLLYAYMVNWRHAWEEPAHIYNTMKLVNGGMYVWLAYLVSSAISINNYGHHILPVSAGGSAGGKAVLNKEVDINLARQIRAFFKNPNKHDDRRICTSFHGQWKFHTTLRGISVVSGSKNKWQVKDILARPAAFSKAVQATTKAGANNALGTAATKKPAAKPKSLHDLGYKTLVGYIRGEFQLNAKTDHLNKRWIVVPMIDTKAAANRVVAAVKPFILEHTIKKENWGYTLRLRRKLMKKKRR